MSAISPSTPASREPAIALRIDNARFKRQVIPGDQLILEADVVRIVRGVGKFKTRASVAGELACEAELIAAIRDAPGC